MVFFQAQQLSAKADREAELVNQNAELSEEVSTIKEDLVGSKQRASEAEAKLTVQNRQLDSALSDRLELEAKVEAASDERRSLLERCLGKTIAMECKKSHKKYRSVQKFSSHVDLLHVVIFIKLIELNIWPAFFVKDRSYPNHDPIKSMLLVISKVQ